MKLLHTSDWHVGKTVRGNGRADEHVAVLAEIVGVATSHEVDLILVAGDLFDSAAPSAEAERIVYHALLALAGTGAELAIISGNHDNARRLEALTPVFEAAGDIHLVTRPVAADRGGVRRLTMRSGEQVNLAMLPFVSKRGIVRAADLLTKAAYELAQEYAARVGSVISMLAGSFHADAVNVLMAHTFVHGGQLGGGERMAHFVEDYAISAQSLPVDAGYVALGHVHRPQKIAAGAPVHYCGSPLQMDFGEQSQTKQVNIVELEPGIPATVTAVKLTSGRPLHTVRGSLEELRAAADESWLVDAWVQAVITDDARAGLADDVRAVLGERVVDVRLERTGRPRGGAPTADLRIGRRPQDLFSEYLDRQGLADERVDRAFADLLDRELSPGDLADD